MRNPRSRPPLAA